MANEYKVTEKLYDTDAYATNFEATILQVEPTPKGLSLILDRTLFFPEEGGQNCDKGILILFNDFANIGNLSLPVNGRNSQQYCLMQGFPTSRFRADTLD